MAIFKDVGRVIFCDLTAFLDYLGHRLAQVMQPLFVDQPLQYDAAVGEKFIALITGHDAGGVIQYIGFKHWLVILRLENLRIGAPWWLHNAVIWPSAAFWCDPGDIFTRVFDVTGFAMDTVLCIDLET